MNMQYLFHILDACLGFQLLLVFFFVPETAYERDIRLEIDQTVDDSTGLKTSNSRIEKGESGIAGDSKMEQTRSASDVPAKKTYWQSLAIWTGTHSDENFFSLLAAPLLVNVNIAALWMVVVTGMLSSFYVSQSFVAAQIFAFPPYLLSAAGVGFLFVGPFLGGLIGSIVLALIMDPLIIWCSKRNNGVYEPEFRLIPAALGLIGGVGVVSYAYVVQNQGSLYTASFLWGLDLFGMIFVLTPANSYVVDAYRELSSEMFISNMMFKNFLFYGEKVKPIAYHDHTDSS
jgi:hypothetical protein